jgi:hypothetical protein
VTQLTVRRHTEQLAVCQLPPDTPLPSWATAAGTLRAAVRSGHELSIVCAIAVVPPEVRHEGPFTGFEVQGPLDLGLTGVLAALVAPLAAATVSAFSLSTFETNWILVPSMQHGAATTALERAGHTVVQPGAGAPEEQA